MKFRIIAIPLALSRKSLSRTPQSVGKPFPLVYYYLQTFPSGSEDETPPNILRRAVNKATGVWTSMGRAPEGNWKHTLYSYGERLMDKVDFEETSLKSFTPPPEGEQATDSKSVILIHPPSLSKPLQDFRDLITHRTPFHTRGLWMWAGIAPLTAPFAIIPIIPNLPFFFCVWRGWSHRRARISSAYIQTLLDKNMLVEEPSEELETVYRSQRFQDSEKHDDMTDAGMAESEKASAGEDRLLLSPGAASDIVALFDLKESAVGDITKALEQANLRLKKAAAESQ